MQETLDTIVGEHQSEATKNRIVLLFDVSNKLNKNLSVISLELILSFLLCISLVMETNSFTRLNLIHHTPISNLKFKKTAFLSDPLSIMQVRQGCLLSMLLYIVAIGVLANFIKY